MISGVRLLDSELMREAGGGFPLWAITDIRFGHLQNWPLHLRLERHGRAIELIFDDVVSFRAHDESEILDHWRERDSENAGVGTVYEINESTYLAEFGTGTAALMEQTFVHYLIAGLDLCVEVLATSRPMVKVAG